MPCPFFLCRPAASRCPLASLRFLPVSVRMSAHRRSQEPCQNGRCPFFILLYHVFLVEMSNASLVVAKSCKITGDCLAIKDFRGINRFPLRAAHHLFHVPCWLRQPLFHALFCGDELSDAMASLPLKGEKREYSKKLQH